MEPEQLKFFIELESWIKSIGPVGILGLLVWVLWKKLENHEKKAAEASKSRDERITELQQNQARFYLEYKEWADKALEVVVDAKLVMQQIRDKIK